MHNDNLHGEKANKYVLLVGEGNFSFGADYVLRTENRIIATCLKVDKQALSEFQLRNIAFIQKHGGIVYTDVDATQLHSHESLAKLEYEAILFNFPHIPGKMKISENRKLLKHFFQSAETLLASEGKIHVTLCKGQSGTPEDGCSRKWSNTWQIVSLAASSDLILCDCVPFKSENYPSYVCTGFRGVEKRFNIEGAITYIFCRGSPIKTDSLICLNQEMTLVAQLDFSVREDFQLLRKVLANSHHPVNKVLAMIAEEVKACNAEVTNLTDWPVFYNHRQQHESLCMPELLTPILQNCCRMAICKHLGEAIPKLEEEEMFIKTALCLPCYSSLELVLHFNPCLVLCTKDHLKMISLIRAILNSVFLNSDMELNEESVLNFYPKVSDLKLTDNTLIYNDGSACKYIAKFLEVDVPMKEECCTKNSQSIVATYDLKILEGHKLYNNIKFSFRNVDAEIISSVKTLNIGSYNQLLYNKETYFHVILDLTSVAMLAYHVSDKRVLYDECAYYTTLAEGNTPWHVFRPLALHSPGYIHDVSFWVGTKFSKLEFLLLIKSILKNLVFGVNQLDSYYDRRRNRHSLCYRFIYSALSQPLSKERTLDIHMGFREALRTVLGVEVR